MQHQLYLRATGTPSEEADEHVAGFYLVEVDEDVPLEHIASAALDIFHSDVAVDVLDDFDFTVFDLEGKLVPVSESEDYEFADRGHVFTVPEPEGVVFEDVSGRLPR